MKLAKLTGSEKQIAWATKIRNEFINKFERYSDKEIEYFSINSAEIVRKAVENVLENEESSKFYIEKIRLAYDVWEAIWVIFLPQYANNQMTQQEKESRKVNIQFTHEEYLGVIELSESDDKFQFTSVKYPAVTGAMDKEAKEIGYNKYGQFVWEAEKKPEWTIEVMSEWLQELGFAVYVN